MIYTLNWPTALTIISLFLTVCFGTWATINSSQWKALYAQVQKGCANPENHYASIRISLGPNQIWSCTPYYKIRREK